MVFRSGSERLRMTAERGRDLFSLQQAQPETRLPRGRLLSAPVYTPTTLFNEASHHGTVGVGGAASDETFKRP